MPVLPAPQIRSALIGIVLAALVGPSVAQGSWEDRTRRNQSPTQSAEWIRTSRRWLEVKGGSNVPDGISSYISAAWLELADEAAALERERTRLMADLDREAQAAAEHNEDGRRQNEAVRAHAALGPHACPCAELARVNEWSDRVDKKRQEIGQWRTRLLEEIERWDEEVEAFDLQAEDLRDVVEEADREAAYIASTKAELGAWLEELRTEVRGTQDALRSLQKSIKESSRESARWRKTAADAAFASMRRTLLMMIDGAIAKLEANYKRGIDEIYKSTGQLAGRDREIQRLTRVGNLKKDSRVIEVLKLKKLGLEELDVAASDTAAAEKAFDAALNTATFALNQPTVKTALGITNPYGQIISATKSMLDFGLDLETFWRSYKRLQQNVKNADGHLAAQAVLSNRMTSLVEAIKVAKSALGG